MMWTDSGPANHICISWVARYRFMCWLVGRRTMAENYADMLSIGTHFGKIAKRYPFGIWANQSHHPWRLDKNPIEKLKMYLKNSTECMRSSSVLIVSIILMPTYFVRYAISNNTGAFKYWDSVLPYRGPYLEDRTVSWPSYLYNGILYSWRDGIYT